MPRLPRKAQIGDIIRVADYEELLLQVLEYTEEIEYHSDGERRASVIYTCRNVDDDSDILIVYDEDVLQVTASGEEARAIVERRKTNQPPKLDLADTIAMYVQRYEEERARIESSRGAKNNNEPRTQWQKEREEKRKAYEYIDYLLDRYAELASLEEILGEDVERQAEMAMLKAEFADKTASKTIQDGKFA